MTQRIIACKHHRRRLLVLLAAMFCLSALLPALGMVLRTAAPDLITIEICSAQGNRLMQVAAGDLSESGAPGQVPAMSHCPLCAPSTTDDHFLPSGTQSVPAWNVATESTSITVFSLFIPAVSRSDSHARAPPVLV